MRRKLPSCALAAHRYAASLAVHEYRIAVNNPNDALGDWLRVPVHGRLRSDDSAVVRQWAVEGHGIANKSNIDLVDDMKAGRLVQILSKYKGPAIPLSLILGTAKPLP